MYLGTMIWAALWDQDLNKVLGFVMSLYPIILGILAIVKGVTLSVKLEKVRKAALQAPGADQAGPSPGQPMSKDNFSQFCSQHGTKFGESEILHVINGLSLTAKNDGQVDIKEWKAWLSGTAHDSWMVLV